MTQAELLQRRQFIGGSDIAAVMGLSRWTTPLQLWAEKSGEIEPKDLSDNEAVELGGELEEFVAKKFERKTGKAVRRAPKNYTHPSYSFMRCQVDRLITGTDELLEVKTCSAWKAKEWEGEEIPQEYILQVMWQLGVTGRSIGHIAVLIGGQSFKYKEIKFDEDLFFRMQRQAILFWDCVENGTPPAAIGMDNQIIAEIYPGSDEQIQEAEDLNVRIALLQEAKMHIAELEKQKDDIEAHLKQRIGDHLGVKTSQYTVTWKRQQRTSVDTEKLKEEGIYDQYSIVMPTRVLRVRKEKENGER